MDRASDGRPRIVVAAEHALFGDGLRTLLKSSRRFVVVHSTSDGHEALRRTRELKPDVLVLDLAAFPDSVIPPGVASSLAPTALVVLTTAPHRSAIEVFIELGARGVILKDAGAGLLLRAIRSVIAGGYWVDREPVTDFAQALYRLGVRTRQRTFGLTDRESEIVGAVASAYSNKEIAQLFEISETTVKHHLTNIFDKVGVSTRLELAMLEPRWLFQREPNRSGKRHRIAHDVAIRGDPVQPQIEPHPDVALDEPSRAAPGVDRAGRSGGFGVHARGSSADAQVTPSIRGAEVK